MRYTTLYEGPSSTMHDEASLRLRFRTICVETLYVLYVYDWNGWDTVDLISMGDAAGPNFPHGPYLHFPCPGSPSSGRTC